MLLYIRAGGRLEQPGGCPERLQQLMSCCWSGPPSERPSFKMCVQEIDSLLDLDSSLSDLSAAYVPFVHHMG